jgi:phage antirepressor YoqD-like protein
LQPKASYYDVVLNCKDLISIGKIAKDYGWSARKMNEYLHEHGVQYKQGKTWLLYQKYAGMGYTSTKTHTYHSDDGTEHAADPHTYWTQKGRLFIYDLLKSGDIYPLIEQGKKAA